MLENDYWPVAYSGDCDFACAALFEATLRVGLSRRRLDLAAYGRARI